MTTEDIFATILGYMRRGVSIHRAMMEAYAFLSLDGYSLEQERHYLEEIQGCIELERYYMEHYHKLLIAAEHQEIEVIPHTWYKYTQEDVDNGTREQGIKAMMTIWINWEKEIKQFLESMYKELQANNEFVTALYILKCANRVSKELIGAEKQLRNLEILEYNSIEIANQQEQYKQGR